VAAREDALHPGAAIAALATALLLQVGANFANDVSDFERGADADDRLGPQRATQLGWVTPDAMRAAAAASFALAVVTGLALVVRGGWPLAVLGALAIAAAIAYTGGPWPLGYHGLGDLVVFLFFGVVGVTGSHYAQALVLSPRALALSVPVGLLATAILTVNNLRDVESDRRAGKRTVAVRLGERATRAYYAALLALAYAGVAIGWGVDLLPAGVGLVLVSAPRAVALGRGVARARGSALNAHLAATARLEAGFAALLALGLLLSR
jgi:1,4-dihydroxy-2-naphthoate octaprenyltransferase